MPPHRLAEELCQQLGSTLPAEQADAAANFARMLMRGTIEDHAAFVRRRSAIVTQLMRHTALSEPHAALLADLAGSPQHRGFMDRRERDAFSYRFGEAVLRRFESSFSGDVDLSSYSEHYGPGETLRLLDAMLAVVGDGGPISPAELRRIEATASELGVEPGVVAHLLRRHDPRHAGGVLRVPLAPRLRIGTSPAADMVLVEPQAGSIRAELVQDPPGTESEAGWRVRDSGSGRPTLLNGKAIREAPFRAGDQLRIGSYTLNLDLEAGMLEAKSDWSAAPLSVRGLSRRLGDVVLLDDVSFTVLRGEVVAVVGPSGSGKTTLLNAITGTTPADSGEVHYEGQPFHDLLARDRSLVGLVPQDDIVHAELSVAESLSFGAALRFPRDADPEDQAEAVERVLDELGMEAIRDRRIGDALHRGISGGQRKRVNLGQELLTRSTRVLFLDEPTSGLDPRAAQEIVRVVRQLADRGRIVFLVTHDLSPQVMALVDHLLVLAPGGRLAWFGPPREACRYFNVDTPDAIFHTFHDRSPTAWAEAWRQSPAYRRYVVLREKLLDLEPAGALPPPPLSRPSPSARTQFMTLVRRYSVVKVRDVGGLVVQLAQPIVLAAVVGVVFPKPTASMLFVVSLSCLWFGMSSSVRELISDRVIWNRERRAGVGVVSYVGSRMVVLAGLTVAQCIALTGFVIGLHDLSSYDFSLLSLAGITSLTGLVGMSLGLCISAFASSSEAAVGALPLLLIPQISFSALLVHLRNMTEIANYLSYLNPQRYAYDAILKTGARIGEQPRYGGPWKEPVGMAGVLYDMGFKGAEAADMGMPLPMLSVILLLFFAVFMAGTLIGVSRRQ